ncbi:hypothetical protein KCP73_18195 [Salmonella enterica subsp. enterica]|nr:hypothetical protein KCP73_18195 [Salmonella enterica subsp. enterica]
MTKDEIENHQYFALLPCRLCAELSKARLKLVLSLFRLFVVVDCGIQRATGAGDDVMMSPVTIYTYCWCFYRALSGWLGPYRLRD